MEKQFPKIEYIMFLGQSEADANFCLSAGFPLPWSCSFQHLDDETTQHCINFCFENLYQFVRYYKYIALRTHSTILTKEEK